jgi:hypothetical protein
MLSAIRGDRESELHQDSDHRPEHHRNHFFNDPNALLLIKFPA